MDCHHCDNSFDTKKKSLQHMLDEHDDELSSHKRDSIKRELNKLQAKEQNSGFQIPKTAVVGAVAVVALAGILYGMSSAGVVTFTAGGTTATSGNVPLGPAGSVHEHAPFVVSIDGERIDFSKPKYQVGQTQNQHVHFEAGDGSTIHKHATGVTIRYALESLGMELNESCVTLDTGKSYCESENGGELSITANGQSVPPEHVIMNGERIMIKYTS